MDDPNHKTLHRYYKRHNARRRERELQAAISARYRLTDTQVTPDQMELIKRFNVPTWARGVRVVEHPELAFFRRKYHLQATANRGH